jgi:recombination protein RecT
MTQQNQTPELNQTADQEQPKQKAPALSPAEVANTQNKAKTFVTQILAKIEVNRDNNYQISPGYPLTNALQEAYLAIVGTADKNGKPVLEACSGNSVADAVMDMVSMEFMPSKSQCYFIAHGDKLTCMPSYFGYQAAAKSIADVYDFIAKEVVKGDEVVTEIIDGEERIVSHTHKRTWGKMNSVDDIVGAYAIAFMLDGTRRYEIMDITQIKAAWAKSATKQGTHQEFPDMMAKKTVLSRLSKRLINTTRNTNMSQGQIQKLNALKKALVYEDTGLLLSSESIVPERAFTQTISTAMMKSSDDNQPSNKESY